MGSLYLKCERFWHQSVFTTSILYQWRCGRTSWSHTNLVNASTLMWNDFGANIEFSCLSILKFWCVISIWSSLVTIHGKVNGNGRPVFIGKRIYMNRIYSGLSQTGQFLLGLYPFLRLIRLSQICLVDAVSKKISKHKQILKKKKTPFALSRYYFGAWDTYDDVTVCLWARFQGQVCEFYSIGIHIFCLFHCNFFLSFFFFFGLLMWMVGCLITIDWVGEEALVLMMLARGLWRVNWLVFQLRYFFFKIILLIVCTLHETRTTGSW